MDNTKVFAMKISKIYPLLVQKAERKSRTKAEVDFHGKITYAAPFSGISCKVSSYSNRFAIAPSFLERSVPLPSVIMPVD